jgi:hypothetical protein
MTEPQPEREPLEIIHLTADTLGRDMLDLLVEELRGMKKGWDQHTSSDQQYLIDRLKGKVRNVIAEGLQVLFRGHYPACPATLDSIQVKRGLQIKLKIAKGARSWHDVIEAEGQQVLLVMADPETFAERMDEIRARADQKELFQGDYSPGEGPYRRDRPAVPPDVSWADVKDKLNEGSDAPRQDGELAFGEAADQPITTAETQSIQQQARELLAAVNCNVDADVADRWSEQECSVAAYWALEYAKDPDTAPARPHWLPIPDPGPSEITATSLEGEPLETATGDELAELEQDDEEDTDPDPETSDDENDETAHA